MPIDPPNKDSPPKWARTLVSAANSRNRAREAKEQRSIEQFSMADLAAVWEECRGCCAVSGLAFGLQIVGCGQAKRPFAPSLDRIDRHKPYQRDNVRLVVSIANFAMNAWGDEPLLQLASALHKKSGDRAPPTKRAPADGDLDNMAMIDAEFVETDVGTVVVDINNCRPVFSAPGHHRYINVAGVAARNLLISNPVFGGMAQSLVQSMTLK
jgi:hypothetical protein